MVHVQPYTVQCVLPINLYNEFIYVFLWYWILFVSAASVFRQLMRIISLTVTSSLFIFVSKSQYLANGGRQRYSHNETKIWPIERR